MGDWYEIGIAVGIGVAAGIALAGILGGSRLGFASTVVGAVATGVVAGLLIDGWLGLGGGVVGATVGSVSAATIVRGASRRGATLGATALLLLGVAVVVGLLALVPAAGYVEAVLLPALAARRSRKAPEKYAGLRSLVK